MTHEPAARLACQETEREVEAAREAWSYIYSRIGWETEKTRRRRLYGEAQARREQAYGRLWAARRRDEEEAEQAEQAALDSNLDIEMGLA